jgi:hypothetical protein
MSRSSIRPTRSTLFLDLFVRFVRKLDIDALQLQRVHKIVEIVIENFGFVKIEGQVQSRQAEFFDAGLDELHERHRLLHPLLNFRLGSKSLKWKITYLQSGAAFYCLFKPTSKLKIYFIN